MSAPAVDNRTLIMQYLDALSGKPKTPELVARYVADTSLGDHIRDVEQAFPAYELISEQMIAEGNFVVMRGTFRGVHRGTFAGIPATGKAVSAGLIIMYRIDEGRIAEHWLQFDLFGLLQQLQS